MVTRITYSVGDDEDRSYLGRGDYMYYFLHAWGRIADGVHQYFVFMGILSSKAEVIHKRLLHELQGYWSQTQ